MGIASQRVQAERRMADLPERLRELAAESSQQNVKEHPTEGADG